jgi:hypothetical protein
LDNFHRSHIPRKENERANTLAQQASGYKITRWMFITKRKPTSHDMITCIGESAKICVTTCPKMEGERPTSSQDNVRDDLVVREDTTGKGSTSCNMAVARVG